MIAVLRSAVFALVFYIGSVPIVVTAMLVGFIAPAAVITVARIWAGWFALTTRWLLGIRWRIVGTVPNHAALVALKHQSNYETIMILWLFKRPAVVLKAELLGIPAWGAAARAHGVIPVDRAGAATALRAMLKAGNAAKAADRPVLIFPEGTRTAVGTAPELRAGLAGLYRALKLPLVPIACDSGRCWPKGFVKHAGVVTFVVGDPIPAGLDRPAIEARVHTAINALNRA
ncbi:1-acyl-sn-glycerol-3-phosphate acyltransferase [Polymorphobacter sp. PAMC 29334]|uniref:lysophospholipid acyltransferase family protein n=1 Tax=Polymorphobacter sp. PAMC 29334 TaxID=2862331 RepID=UPI001C685DB8|nr:lysophospholipid acyltransferase family protein [Polymorphobacter sp. PAMC 29334]QYE33860.1 1-acyl-sn-glycerol-3-phosphate acyltransferase [Polymorphobacter sp. PAMC 29334]